MTLKEIEEKRAELIEKAKTATAEELERLELEAKKLDFQRSQIATNEQRAKEQEEYEAEQRAARKPNNPPPTEADKIGLQLLGVHDATNNGVVNTDEARAMDKATEIKFARTAFAKQVRSVIEKRAIPLNELEKRALGVAVTTTSTEFKAPTAEADGVNNGGIFIPQNLLYDLLETESIDSAFYRDVIPTYIKGTVVFPYVKDSNNGTPKGKKETVAANDRSIEWEKLTLAQGNYPLTIEVTMELLALTDEQFAQYLLQDLANEMDLLLSEEILYGTGSSEDATIAGVTVGAIQGTAYQAGGEADAIKTGLLALSRRARIGAKVYVSRSMLVNMTFEKDSTGRYIFPIYNDAGISSIASIPVEVDESLKDGDFIIGNAKNYKLNVTQNTVIYPDVDGRKRILEYTAHLMIAGKAAPNKFYYGKKA